MDFITLAALGGDGAVCLSGRQSVGPANVVQTEVFQQVLDWEHGENMQTDSASHWATVQMLDNYWMDCHKLLQVCTVPRGRILMPLVILWLTYQQFDIWCIHN